MKHIGQVLKEARLALGLKAIDVADELHIDESTWYKIEAGERNLNIAYLIAVSDYLKIPRFELLRALGVPLLDHDTPGNPEYVIYSRKRCEKNSFLGNIECVEKRIGDRDEYELSLLLRTAMGLGPDDYDEDFARVMDRISKVRLNSFYDKVSNEIVNNIIE